MRSTTNGTPHLEFIPFGFGPNVPQFWVSARPKDRAILCSVSTRAKRTHQNNTTVPASFLPTPSTPQTPNSYCNIRSGTPVRPMRTPAKFTPGLDIARTIQAPMTTLANRTSLTASVMCIPRTQMHKVWAVFHEVRPSTLLTGDLALI